MATNQNGDVDFIARDKRLYGEYENLYVASRGAMALASLTIGVPVAAVSALFSVPQKMLLGKEKKTIGGKKLEFPEVGPLLVEGGVKPLAERELDIVMYGATGFTGSLAAKYLAKQYGSSIKWGIAGRRLDALDKVKKECLALNPQIPEDHIKVIQVDAQNDAQLQAMCSRTRVVISTVGPFVNYGTPLVRAAIATGSNVCDITGEVDWVVGIIDRYDELARKAGSKIVSFCGHDSVPWDLTAFMLAKKLKEEKGEEVKSFEMVDAVRGKPSGGTLESVLESPTTPYKPIHGNFSPLRRSDDGTESPFKTRDRSKLLPTKASTNQWGGPFIMSIVNSKVVERSNALNGYGKDVSYMEHRVSNSLSSVIGRYLELIALGPVLMLPSSLRYKFLPAPGEGPSDEDMEKAFLQVTGVATGIQGSRVGSRIYFRQDPGYRDTARMLVETGLSIALSPDRCQRKAGCLTPGSCCAEVLLERLIATGTEFTYLSKI